MKDADPQSEALKCRGAGVEVCELCAANACEQDVSVVRAQSDGELDAYSPHDLQRSAAFATARVESNTGCS